MDSALAPGFLLASPPLGDPNFDRTVVLLVMHGDSGALGFVVNRPARLTVGKTLTLADYEVSEACEACPVYVGGPVQPSSGWILGPKDAVGEGSGNVLRVGDDLRVTSSRRAFTRLADDLAALAPGERDPASRAVLLGYSGWGPGQLEREIGHGVWLPTPFEPEILFDVEPESRWQRAYDRLGVSPASLMSMRTVGSA
jgi:putative transcriptional regulator